MSNEIHICMSCTFRQRPCAGACFCSKDGKPITEHVALRQCPEHLFDSPRLSRPPEKVPDDFDPAQEQRRMQQGGCCGKASR